MNEGGRNGERMGYIEREGLMDAWERGRGTDCTVWRKLHRGRCIVVERKGGQRE